MLGYCKADSARSRGYKLFRFQDASLLRGVKFRNRALYPDSFVSEVISFGVHSKHAESHDVVDNYFYNFAYHKYDKCFFKCSVLPAQPKCQNSINSCHQPIDKIHLFSANCNIYHARRGTHKHKEQHRSNYHCQSSSLLP